MIKHSVDIVGGNRENNNNMLSTVLYSPLVLGQIVAPIDHNLHTKDFQLVKEMITYFPVSCSGAPTTAIIDWNLFSSTTTGAQIPQ